MLKLIQYFSDNRFTRESFLGWYFEDEEGTLFFNYRNGRLWMSAPSNYLPVTSMSVNSDFNNRVMKLKTEKVFIDNLWKISLKHRRSFIAFCDQYPKVSIAKLARHYVKMAKESEWENEFIPRLVNHPSYQGSTTPAQKIYFQQMHLAHQAQARHNENISR